MRMTAPFTTAALVALTAAPALAALSGPYVSGTTYPTTTIPSGVTTLTLTSPTGTYPYGGSTLLTPAAGLSIDVSGASPAGNGLVRGNGPNTTPYTYYVAPYESATQQYTAPYLVPGYYTGKITYDFSPATTPIRAFGFLWGSVDNFNQLTINVVATDGSGTTSQLVVNGADLPSSGGTTTPDNSYYVIFNTAANFAFSTIVASDTAPSTRTDLYTFEQVPLFISGTQQVVAEPAAFALLGAGLVGAAFLRRRA